MSEELTPVPAPAPLPNLPPKKKRTHYWKPGELLDREYEELPFYGVWAELIGMPQPNFRCIVHGPAKHGKSTFTLRFAKFLSELGKVMYVSAEEGINKTFRDRLIRESILASDPICILPEKNWANVKTAVKNWKPKFLIVDSVQRCKGLTNDELAALHDRHKKLATILILHGSKGGGYKGDTDWAHDADIIVRVENGVAHQSGRFQAPSEMMIVDPKHLKKAQNKRPQQPQLFEQQL